MGYSLLLFCVADVYLPTMNIHPSPPALSILSIYSRKPFLIPTPFLVLVWVYPPSLASDCCASYLFIVYRSHCKKEELGVFLVSLHFQDFLSYFSVHPFNFFRKYFSTICLL
ncbi:hypothetical protein PM082_009828 [Marasmius tenuissimus]|nr:hypothetical protein PM082_009828 [Marasmius tenuissimus]